MYNKKVHYNLKKDPIIKFVLLLLLLIMRMNMRTFLMRCGCIHDFTWLANKTLRVLHKLKEFNFYLCLIFHECIPNCLDKGLNFITFI